MQPLTPFVYLDFTQELVSAVSFELLDECRASFVGMSGGSDSIRTTCCARRLAVENPQCFRTVGEVQRLEPQKRWSANWLSEFFMGTGPEAVARRERALPLIAEDGTRMPDLFALGPATPRPRASEGASMARSESGKLRCVRRPVYGIRTHPLHTT